MVAFLTRQRLSQPFTIAIAAALVAGAMSLIVPADTLGDWSMKSGIASIIAAAEPPLGNTARAGFAFVMATTVGGFVWLAAFAISGIKLPKRRSRRRSADVISLGDANVPQVRRADAHPDAPPRPPVLANRDLGIPFLDVHAADATAAAPAVSDSDGSDAHVAADPHSAEPEIVDPVIPAQVEPYHSVPPAEPEEEQEIPVDLDVPMSQHDPRSFDAMGGRIAPPRPKPRPRMEAVPRRPVSPRRPKPQRDARIETFELTPQVRNPEAVDQKRRAPVTARQTEETLKALLTRLEHSVAERGFDSDKAEAKPKPKQQEPAHRVESALEELRRLATKV